MNLDRPTPQEHSLYFQRYISLVSEDDVLAALERQIEDLHAALDPVTEERASYRYADGKWSIRQLVGHLIDAERVFGFRALSIARGEPKPLPGFEEDDYAASSGHDGCPLAELVTELELLRRSHVSMFRHLPAGASTRTGVVNGNSTSVRAIAFIIVGHVRHHLSVLRSKYGARLGP